MEHLGAVASNLAVTVAKATVFALVSWEVLKTMWRGERGLKELGRSLLVLGVLFWAVLNLGAVWAVVQQVGGVLGAGLLDAVRQAL